ncbi:Na+/H+ antiporter NhaA [Ornithinimicrobium cerasi]|uniref:Na+/H+ antiporter NhaA n=1 Tax=Ornithinimicrobium cerasi TaxID=2248773 RepID=UPI000F002C58|nr:Na+/H+ antiporter NhaA [Ornithinimicrobium cerasi]
MTPRGASRARRRALVGQLSEPVRSFLSTEAGGATLLLLAAVVALGWANSPWSASYEALRHTEAGVVVGGLELVMDLEHWVDDGLMALFFFVLGLEVRREVSVGELRDPRRATIPLLAGLGGMVLPTALYLLIAPGGEAARGWAAVIGTDTAFLLGALAVVGPVFSTQLRIFLLTLTVVDDIVAVSVIGLVYSDDVRVLPLLGMLVLGALIAAMSRAGVWRVAPYAVLGLVLWLVTLEAGLHASIAGMLAGLLVGAAEPRREVVDGAVERFRAFRQSPHVDVGRRASEGLARAVSVNDRLQASLHPWSSYVVVPVFALTNAGIDLRDGVLADALTSRLTWAVVVGLVVGKTLGIGLTCFLALRLRLGGLPSGVGPGHVLGGSALSGIGFTVSLLVVGLAFDDEQLRAQATVGVLLAAVLATLLGWALFRAAAVLRGEGDADLPRVLDRPVDPGRGDHVLGPHDAPLTLVEYADFECPFCAEATGVGAELRARFGEELRYVFRHLPLPDVHPRAELAARAAEAAARQGFFWQMHDVLFGRQDALERVELVGHAQDLGMDVDRFMLDLDDPEVAQRVRDDVASAEASGARGTPTFYVGEHRHTGPWDSQTLARALEAARDRGPTLPD